MSSSVKRRARAHHPSRPATSRRTAQGIVDAGRAEQLWRARVGDLIELGALASLVLVVAVFLRAGGSAALTSGSWPERLIGVGRLTGLVAVDLLLLQLLSAARLPWVDRVHGADRGLRAHRILGRVTVPLVLVHVESLVLGYAVRDGLSAWTGWAAEPFRILTDVPDLLTATAATALLVVIAVTSVRAAMRSMSYERWHLVHLTAYAAVALAIPHQLSIGSDLTANPWMHGYWLALYVGVAGSIVWWRLLVPVTRSLLHGLRVESVVEEAPGTWSVWVGERHLEALEARAGQFANWRFLAPTSGCSPTPGPCRASPTDVTCASPCATSATTHAPWPTCGPAPACSSKAPTAPSPRGDAPAARSSCSPPGSASPRCGRSLRSSRTTRRPGRGT